MFVLGACRTNSQGSPAPETPQVVTVLTGRRGDDSSPGDWCAESDSGGMGGEVPSVM
ncbi:hypothetical protein SVIO_103270 [Streptomyces violaceusniger]|uniref:Uncharacterized protein n=1 Tax=Streptomyces violaceusniger TaxID=68280 RepID=A0A4D4LH17_STRVO|nr:hypothetical protein SVIO_103270 [Streptomyces violaceusniger]